MLRARLVNQVHGLVQRVARAQSLYFFFQAEDGIRDLTVTGVQTCALPICRAAPARRCANGAGRRSPAYPRAARCTAGPRARAAARGAWHKACPPGGRTRSGERRVGEEWRSRWAPDHLKKKKKKEEIDTGRE